MGSTPNLAIILGVLFCVGVIALAVCLNAFFLRISTRIVSGFKPPFGQAWRISIILFISTFIAGSLVSLIGRPFFGRHPDPLAINLQCTVIGLLVGAAVYGKTLKHPDEGVIGCGKGFLVSLVQHLLGLALGICFAAVLFLTGHAPPNYRQLLHAAYARTASMQSTHAAPAPSSPQVITTVQEAQKEAVRRYPELSVAGSKFNGEFVARYKRYQRESPGYFQDKLWPISLAEETDESLKVK